MYLFILINILLKEGGVFIEIKLYFFFFEYIFE